MLGKWLLAVGCLILVCSCAALKENSPSHNLTAEDLQGMTLDVTINSASSRVIPQEFQRSEGRTTIYFAEGELFYDATNMNGWHFATDYRVEKTSDRALVVTAKVPDGGSYSMRNTLVFTRAKGGYATTEFFDQGKLVDTHLGKFTLSLKPFSLIQREMVNNIYTFTVKDSAINKGLISGQKIEARFSNNSRVTFIFNDREFHSRNNAVVQSGVSHITMSGTFDHTNTPYQIELDYIDFRAGSFTIVLDNGESTASGSFTSFRVTGVEPVALKGRLVQGNSFSSATTGITYPYEVYLPPGYGKSNKKYPVIYTTDGQWQKEFAHILDAHNKRVILVSIEQGPDDRRAIDYHPPGASIYTRFLKEEFIPFIEANYLTTSIRTYAGQSAGGALGAVLISEESGPNPWFKNYILADSSFWALTPDIIAAEEANYRRSKKLPITILLSGTWQGNAAVTRNYARRFRERSYQGLRILNKTYALTHEEMSPPTFIEYLDFID